MAPIYFPRPWVGGTFSVNIHPFQIGRPQLVVTLSPVAFAKSNVVALHWSAARLQSLRTNTLLKYSSGCMYSLLE